MDASNQVMDIVNPSQLDWDGETTVDEKKSFNIDHSAEIKLKLFEKRYEKFAKKAANYSQQSDLYIKTLQREIVDSLLKAATAAKRCETCGAFSPAFRKDGASKIFQKPLSKRHQKAMSALKLKLKTGINVLSSPNLENRHNDAEESDEDIQDIRDDDDDDDESEGTDSEGSTEVAGDASKSQDKYLTVLEVEAQIKLMWKNNAEALNFIWSRALGLGLDIDLKRADAWSLFFTRVIVVTPNRFRPSSTVGEIAADHPQNVHLKKIIENNLLLRKLHQEMASGGEASIVDGGLDQPLDRNKHLSKVVATWIEIQNAVNCYMDSSKDPNPLGSKDTPAGIRQLLERKEGLFRRHMMGKRVNYCCRSVISPDPYLGTNEVGIPVHFAKELHYPIPVNDWNVNYLRKLVERGPDQYPGRPCCLIKIKHFLCY